MVERQQLRADAGHPVDVEQVPPDLAGALRRVADRLDHAGEAGRVPRPPRSGAGRAHTPPAGRRAPAAPAPSRRRPRGPTPGRPVADAATSPSCGRTFLDCALPPPAGSRRRARRPRPSRGSGPAGQLEVVVERRAIARDLHIPAERRDAVAEAPVERVLGGPQIGHGLAALVDVVDLRTHEPPQDPAAPMRRQHAHERDAGRADQSARNPRLERKGAAASDHLAVLERRVDAVGRDDRAEPRREFIVRVEAPEVVHDRAHHFGELLRPCRPDLDAQAIRSSGA